MKYINTNYLQDTITDLLLDVCADSKEADLLFNVIGMDFKQIETVDKMGI